MSRVALLCAGLDRVRRGYETHVRVLHETLRDDPLAGVKVVLFKRVGVSRADESCLRTPWREGWLCRCLALVRGDALYWEYVLFALMFVARCMVLRERFDTVACIEPMVAKTIMHFRKWIPGTPRIAFSHGVWMDPQNYCDIGDLIHEVNIENFDRMLGYLGVSKSLGKVVCIPHFLPECDGSAGRSKPSREAMGILTPFVALAVGVIDSDHKRTDHVIREVASLGEKWSLLVCGMPKGQDGESVAALGRELLGPRFVQTTLPSEEMWKAYAVADVFVLGSLNEGFGIVIIEAMRAGLPVIAHDRPLFRWILGSSGMCVRMDRTGDLSAALRDLCGRPEEVARMRTASLREFRKRFTWSCVREAYVRLLQAN